jgi:16S rRNA (uracil1498-N3)-methyltransferase
LITLLVSPDELDKSPIEVSGDSYRHLFRARRLEVGARVRVVDGEGQARWSTVERVDRAGAELAVVGEAPGNEPERELVLMVAAPKIQRASWLVEKVTEVGATAIRFVNSERSPRSYGEASLARLRRVATAAVERWFLDRGGAAGMDAGAGPVGLLVGPEGGWTESEREFLLGLDCRPWGLGVRTLRVETAAVAGSSLLLLTDSAL